MTRVLLATPENFRREIPHMNEHATKTLLFAIMWVRSVSHAATITIPDYPIFIYDVREEDTIRILIHEENHRALLFIGETEGSRDLDHPRVTKLIDGRRVGNGYRRIHNLYRGLSASPKTEAR